MSESKIIAQRILHRLKDSPFDIQIFRDAFTVAREIEKEDFRFSHSMNKMIRVYAGNAVKESDVGNRGDYFNIYKDTLLFDAPHDFDSFLLYIEIMRKPEERFYQPRRRVLKQVVDALQDLVDDKLDELFVSMPPRVGKTSLLLFFICWLIGRDSNRSNLYSAYSDIITTPFYNGVLEVINDTTTYLWHDVFPTSKIAKTNGKDETLDIDRAKHYPTLTCRSVHGTLNGACDCNGMLIYDDLVSGIEEAMNIDRMRSLWAIFDNNLITRAKENAKILGVGTRWSVNDPAGIRMEMLTNDQKFKGRRFKVINLPALNDKDESNFEYDYGVGFSTKYYHERRASFERNNDLASWLAQYQGEPIEREGAVFNPSEMRYFNGVLPDKEPDRIFMAVDPAYGGGDYVAAPICFKYDDDIYVVDVIFDNRDKKVTQPRIASKIVEYGVTYTQIEATKATESYREGVNAALDQLKYRANVTSKAAPVTSAKQARIFDIAPDIREKMIFIESGKRSKEYELFMQNVFSFKAFGKNKNDDAPDSLCQAINMITDRSGHFKIFKRPF